jgi:hypothetical protein
LSERRLPDGITRNPAGDGRLDAGLTACQLTGNHRRCRRQSKCRAYTVRPGRSLARAFHP